MNRYGTRGQGISAGQLLARDAARQRRAEYANSPERVAFRRQVRELVLKGRVNADPTSEQAAHARQTLRTMGVKVAEGSLA